MRSSREQILVPGGLARSLGCLAVALILAACGDSDEDAAPDLQALAATSDPAPAQPGDDTLNTCGGDGDQPCGPTDPGASAGGGSTQPDLPAAPPGGVVAASTDDTLRHCGNEGESACGLFEKDRWNGQCDTGLQLSRERCGCRLHGLFGNCLIPQYCDLCRNDTRHRPATASLYASSWEHWALKNQREQLAVDEPLNWVMHLGTHNAFNSFSDGHQPRVFNRNPVDGVIGDFVDAPNQFYSMSTQLDLDSRMLAIDAHWVGGALGDTQNARLCHSLGTVGLEDLICRTSSPDSDGDLFPSMRYFANGIKEIMNWLERHPDAILVLNLENFVGCDTCRSGDAAYITQPLRAYLDRLTTPAGPVGPGHGWILARTGLHPVTGKRIDPLPSRAELLAMGKRVIVLFNGDVSLGDDVDPDMGFPEASVVFGGFDDWKRNNQDFNCHGEDALSGAGRGDFTVVAEDRTLQSGFLQLVGQLSTEDLRQVAQCNYTIVATDFLGSELPLGRRFDMPDFSRHAALVWSWNPGDRGQNGDCAMLEAASGRWVSADCTQPRRYACAPPRSESGTDDRSQWQQREFRWHFTQASGPWDGGAAACAAEFPFDADGGRKVFSAPVNGYQNRWLNAANTAGVDVWLNYTDQEHEGTWVIPKLANLNTPPVADAGADQELECGCDTVLDGSASVDADGDALTFTWTGPFGTLTGPVVTARFEAGVHVVTLAVADGQGGVSTDSVTVTVTDTEPPSLSVSLSPSVLWPPNRKLVKVVADVRAHDQCDGADVLIELNSIVSSEPEKRNGHNRTAPDIQDAEFGTGDLEFSLRAERSHHGARRVYTVSYRATDKAGNTTKARARVVVPKGKAHIPGN